MSARHHTLEAQIQSVVGINAFGALEVMHTDLLALGQEAVLLDYQRQDMQP